MFKSGFVTIIGRPNVGKSTFLNATLKQKVAIMSDKPQTTRHKIQGIYTSDTAQIIFIDTPGIHTPKNKLQDFMMKQSFSATKDTDIILWMVDASAAFMHGEQFILDYLKKKQVPVILVINKLDLLTKEKLLECIVGWQHRFDFLDIVPISALANENIDRLIEVIEKQLPNGPLYYPSDQVSDHPERFIMAELIREKILQLTREEIPHSVAVVIEKITTEKNKVHVDAVIIVERDSQKRIIVGKNGSMIKEIGILARQDIENLLGTRIMLSTFVKVEKNWQNRSRQLMDFGFNEKDY